MEPVTHKKLLALLDYCAETGVFTWRARPYRGRAGLVGQRAGGLRKDGYWRITVDGGEYQAHRLAWFYAHAAWPSEQIDHINGMRHDNRIANLREATQSQNQQNQRTARSNNHTGLLGVIKTGNRWTASIGMNGRNKYIGTFRTAEEAHAAYVAAKRIEHTHGTL